MLTQWGYGDKAEEEKRQRKTRRLERDIENVLATLADDYPLLATLVERHRGGQRRLPIGAGGQGAVVPIAPEREAPPESDDASKAQERNGEQQSSPERSAGLPGSSGRRRPARYSLTIRFEHRPDDPSLGRLVESTVWVNEAHAAYSRAVATHAEPYHIAVTVAMALAPLAVESDFVHGFVTEFLAKWGAGEVRTKRRRRVG